MKTHPPPHLNRPTKIEPALELDKIGFRYAAEWVLRDISLTIQHGEFLGIIGPNGSGKTTLLKIMTGLLKAGEGQVRINGRPLGDIRKKDLAGQVALVAQETSAAFSFSVREIVLMGRHPHLGFLAFEGEKDADIAEAAMDMAGILPFGGRDIHELSGGERQRVWIARALAQQPDIMMLDEPTAFQDIRHQVDFFHLIRNLNRDRGLTVVAVTHDINMASSFCDRLVLLNRGGVFASGHPDQVITARHLREVYAMDVLVDQSPIDGRPRLTLSGRDHTRHGDGVRYGDD